MKSVISLLPLAILALGTPHNLEQQPLDIEKQIPFEASGASPQKNGLGIPLLGFGTWNLKENCTKAVAYAIKEGYRHIDCAKAYGNEHDVGRGIAEGLAMTGLKREDLWITSKLWNNA